MKNKREGKGRLVPMVCALLRSPAHQHGKRAADRLPRFPLNSAEKRRRCASSLFSCRNHAEHEVRSCAADRLSLSVGGQVRKESREQRDEAPARIPTRLTQRPRRQRNDTQVRGYWKILRNRFAVFPRWRDILSQQTSCPTRHPVPDIFSAQSFRRAAFLNSLSFFRGFFLFSPTDAFEK